MKTAYIVGAVVALVIIVLYMSNYDYDRHVPPRRYMIKTRVDNGNNGNNGIEKLDTVLFDGMPAGELYHTENGVASATECAKSCVSDTACDSWAYNTIDSICEKRRNIESSNSMTFWKVKNGMLKVPGRQLNKEMMKEQIADGADTCANLCALDPMCSTATYSNSDKKCYTGTTLSGPDIIAGIIPARRSAVDLARNE